MRDDQLPDKSGSRLGTGRTARGTQASSPLPRFAVSRFGLAGGTFAFGLCFTLVGYLFALERDETSEQAAFEGRAQEATLALFRHFELPLEIAFSVPAFMGVHPDASFQDFARFAAPALERHPSITALEWAPKVPSSERENFEQTVAEIWMPDPSENKLRSPDRREHFAIAYVVPDVAPLRGLDIAFDETRRAAVEHAGRTGSSALSPPFRLVGDPPQILSISILTPVVSARSGEPWQATTRGFAVCLFRVQAMVDEAFAKTDLKGLSYSLYDEGDPHRPVLLASNQGQAGAVLEDRFHWEKSQTFVDRRWRMVMRSARGAAGGGGNAIWVLWIGLVFSSVSSVALYALLALRGALRQGVRSEQMGNYTLVRRLGEGGMGVVYEAQHSLLRRRTAVKLIRQDAATELSLERFEREVQATSQLTHPNTVQLFDYGRSPDGIFYYAMEYIEGVTLRDLVEVAGPLAPARALHLIAQATGALAEAHRLGMIHRDLKPDNMMVCDRGGIPDFVKVLDFGLVKNRAFEERGFITKEHAMVGTPEYMAPEAFSGGAHLTAASDVYGLGSVLYFLLTGRPPYTAPTLMALVAKASTTSVEPPRLDPTDPISGDLSRLVLACLSREIGQRPKDARQLQAALEPLQQRAPWTVAEALAFWDAWGSKFEQHARAREARFKTQETLRIDVLAARQRAG